MKAITQTIAGRTIKGAGRVQNSRAKGRHLAPGYHFLIAVLLLCSGTALPAAVLEPSGGNPAAPFGSSVSLSGGNALVGAPGDLDGFSYSGSAYYYGGVDTASGTVAPDAVLGDGGVGFTSHGFAQSVSLSGNRALVGDPATGFAYNFGNLNGGSPTEVSTLEASDGAFGGRFGWAVSADSSWSLVGAPDAGIDSAGAAYFYKTPGSGSQTESAILKSSDGSFGDDFGQSVSLFRNNNSAVVGASGHNNGAGAAYYYGQLNQKNGEVMEDVKLEASGGSAGDNFGHSVSVHQERALVGATNGNGGTGNAYVYDSLDSSSGTVTQDNTLVASDAENGDQFGVSVSLRGSRALVGASGEDEKGNDAGAAYYYDNVNGSGGETLKLMASDGAAGDRFGSSVSLDAQGGDLLLIGASGAKKAYTADVSAMTTANGGNTSYETDGISFKSQTSWIIGQNSDGNTVHLGEGDTADIAAPLSGVSIGQEAGSDNNILMVDGMLLTWGLRVGSITGNSGNQLIIGETGTVSTTIGIYVSTGNSLEINGTVIGQIVVDPGAEFMVGATGEISGNMTVGTGSEIGGGGMIDGDLTFEDGALFAFDPVAPLTVTGSVNFEGDFGIDDLVGLDSTVEIGVYTLIDGTSTDFSLVITENWGEENAFDLGDGKRAYFSQGSLQVTIVPEPATSALLLLAGGALALRRRRS